MTALYSSSPLSITTQLIGRIAQAVRELPRNAGQQGSSNSRVFVQNDLGASFLGRGVFVAAPGVAPSHTMANFCR
jgi:hypothetical protein